jgi:hypothetical protein
MLRAFDNWDSYLNNDGHLLHGKIRFCRKATTDNITIYNTDGVPLRNPIFTDSIGRTEYQVFVENDANVTAYFYQYIGTGDMTHYPDEDYDPSRWSYQYSSDSMDPTQSLVIQSTGADGVDNMDALRSKDIDDVPSVAGVKMLWLYGYYNAGDTSPVLYVWDSACLEDDDGGSVIKSNNVPGPGRWILSTKELHMDVRHFGIFPTDDMYSTDYSYTSQLANCAAYADKIGVDCWFPALKDEISYYLFDGTNTFAIHGDIYVSDAVRFQCKTGTTGTIISCHELHKRTPQLFVSTVQTGTATLVADWVNISWVGGNCTGDARIGWVIDSDEYPRVIANKEVRFDANGHSSLQLDNCLITSNKKITGEITIQNSVINTDFFSDDYDWSDFHTNGNTILLKNCKDANTYVILKNKQGEVNYGDLGEQTLSNVTLAAGCIVENAVFDTVTVQGATEIHNVSGSITVSGSNLALNAVDCWLFLQNASTADSVALRRGSLGGANLQVLNSLFLDNVEVNTELTTLGATATVQNSVINADIICSDISLVSNTVNADIQQRDVDSTVTVDVRNNKFVGPDGKHSIVPTHSNSVVTGAWIGNDAVGGTSSYLPIVLDMTKLLNNDSLHSYRYEGNTGKFLPKKSKFLLTYADVRTFENVTHASGYVALHPDSTPSISLVLAGVKLAQTDQYSVGSSIYIKPGVSMSMPFFGIGQATVNLLTTVTIFFTGASYRGRGTSLPFGEAFSNQSMSATRLLTLCTVADPQHFDASSLAANAVLTPAWIGCDGWTTPGWVGGGNHSQGDPGTGTIQVEMV